MSDSAEVCLYEWCYSKIVDFFIIFLEICNVFKKKIDCINMYVYYGKIESIS